MGTSLVSIERRGRIMKNIKLGDYINGRIVEKIEIDGDTTYYLITYFCNKLNKPQSKKLESRDIKTIVKKEDFENIAQTI